MNFWQPASRARWMTRAKSSSWRWVPWYSPRKMGSVKLMPIYLGELMGEGCWTEGCADQHRCILIFEGRPWWRVCRLMVRELRDGKLWIVVGDGKVVNG